MARFDISPLTGAISNANKSAPKLNDALDDLEKKHVALAAATTAYNDAIVVAGNAITDVTTDVTNVRDAADGLLGQNITLPAPVALPDDLPPELVRARNVKLTK